MNRSISYLTFYIGKKEFALPAEKIQTIFDISSTQVIDSEINFMRGVAIKDSGVLPIVDLGKILGISGFQMSDSSSVILANFTLSGKIFKIGLIADMVTSVLNINKKLVADSESDNSSSMPKEVEAVVTDKSQKIYLLNLESLLSEDDLLDLFIEIKKFIGCRVD